MKLEKEKLTILFFLGIFLLTGCYNDDDSEKEANQVCNMNNSLFKQLYEDIIQMNSTVIENATFDAEVHGYTFAVSSNKQICRIGYQSFTIDPNTVYKIEIIDNSNNSQIYYGEHIFSQTNTSYVEIPTPINIFTNSTYTIKRTQDTYASVIETIGVGIEKYENFQYQSILPHTFNDLTVLSAGGDVFANDLLPYGEALIRLPLIDIVFLE